MLDPNCIKCDQEFSFLCIECRDDYEIDIDTCVEKNFFC